MNGWFNPDNWMDVFDHILLIIGAVVIAVVPGWYAAKSHRAIKDVKEQVVNGHKVPMRFDLDRVLERLEELFNTVSDVARGVHGLRADLSDEEARRRENVRELRTDIERNRGEIRHGISEIERRIDKLEQEINPQ